jgi:hypothetical protein
VLGDPLAVEVDRAALRDRAHRDDVVGDHELADHADLERYGELARQLGCDGDAAAPQADDDGIEEALQPQRIGELATGIGAIPEPHVASCCNRGAAVVAGHGAPIRRNRRSRGPRTRTNCAVGRRRAPGGCRHVRCYEELSWRSRSAVR